jgi:TBC1 domain family member 2
MSSTTTNGDTENKTTPTITLPPRLPPKKETETTTSLLSEDVYKFNKFKSNFFTGDTVNITKLQSASWNGVPYQYRAISWMIMLGYLPANRNRRKQCLKRKREDYARFVSKYFDSPSGERSTAEQETLRQVLVDVPRTQPDSPLFAQKPIRRMLERILYVWALRHPASGYVQGINDVACPFILVFLDHYLRMKSSSMDIPQTLKFDERTRAHISAATCDVGAVSSDILHAVEADVYFCLERFLNFVQRNFTPYVVSYSLSLSLTLECLCIDTHTHTHT